MILFFTFAIRNKQFFSYSYPKTAMSNILTEITPLSDKDCFYLVDRHKTSFDFPLHQHGEYELNFISNCSGAQRVVGDSIETLGDYDLVLLGPGLEHSWEQANCDNSDKREITIQFTATLFNQELLNKNQLAPIRLLLEKAQLGIAFDMSTIMRIYTRLDNLTYSENGFQQLLQLMEILYALGTSDGARTLASKSFTRAEHSTESRRVKKIEEEIARNFNQTLTLDHLASVVGMSPTAFSRFFRQRTGRTLSEYIIDIRLGHAARQLVDTSKTVAEICYECGFNNISNFNRAFKRNKGCSPKAFRENYLKTKVII